MLSLAIDVTKITSQVKRHIIISRIYFCESIHKLIQKRFILLTTNYTAYDDCYYFQLIIN